MTHAVLKEWITDTQNTHNSVMYTVQDRRCPPYNNVTHHMVGQGIFHCMLVV